MVRFQDSTDLGRHLVAFKLGGVFPVSGSEVKVELCKEANEICAAKGKKEGATHFYAC